MSNLFVDQQSNSSEDEPPESLKYNQIQQQHENEDLLISDSFFRNLYDYHQKSGFFCILLAQFLYVLTILFTILFSTFISTCVDWNSIRNGTRKDLISAMYPYCSPPSGVNVIVIFFFMIFMIWWTIVCVNTVVYLCSMYNIHKFWHYNLGFYAEHDLASNSWENVIERCQERISVHLDIHYTTNKIMRWENYLIAMITKDTLGLDNIPFTFTKILEWNLHKCITGALFDENEMLLYDVTKESCMEEYNIRLKRAFYYTGILNVVFAPFILSALSVYFIYKYLSDYHKNPKALGIFSFTALSKWKLRDFNELEHVYIKRLNNSHPKIINYLSQFVNEPLNILLQFISFILGSMLVSLLTVSFFNSNLIISLFIVEQPVIFYVGIFTGLFVMINNHTTDNYVFEPEKTFQELVQALNYVPLEWDGMTQKQRYSEIKKIFRYKWVIFINEVLSVVYTPLLLLFWLPKRSRKIIDFFREHSVIINNNNLGIISSFALFNKQLQQYQHLSNTRPQQNTLDDKMSRSISNFKQSFPTWNQENTGQSRNKDSIEDSRMFRELINNITPSETEFLSKSVSALSRQYFTPIKNPIDNFSNNRDLCGARSNFSRNLGSRNINIKTNTPKEQDLESNTRDNKLCLSDTTNFFDSLDHIVDDAQSSSSSHTITLYD
jgi:autophagy-related protein 9